MEGRHFIFILLALLVQQCVTSPVWQPQFLSGGTGRNIRHLPCVSRRTGDTGTCMFAIHCMKANGTHLGTCIDRFYFGSCCRLNDQPALTHNNESNYLPVLPPSKVTYTTERVRTTTPKRITHPVANDVTTETNYQLSTFQSVQDNENTVVVDLLSTSRPQSDVTVSVVSSSQETTTFKSTTSPKPPLTTVKPIKTTTLKPTKATTSKPKPTYQKPTTTSPKPTKATTTSKPAKPVTKPTKLPYLEDTTKPTKPSTTTSSPITSRPSTSKTTTTTTSKPTKKPAPTKKPTTKPTTPPPTEEELSEVSLITKPDASATPTTTTTTKPETTTTTKPEKTTQKPSKITTKPTTTATKPTKTTPKPTTLKPTKPPTTVSKPVKTTSKPPRPSSTPVPKPVADVTAKPTTTSTTTTTTTKKPPIDALGEFNQIEGSTKQPSTSGGLVTWTSVDLGSQPPTTQATSTTEEATTTTTTTTEIPDVTTSSSSSSETSINTESWVLIPDPTPPPMATANTESTSSSTPLSAEEVVTEEQLPMTSGEPSSLNMSDFTDVCGRRLFPEARIVGGEKASFGKWPWQISLRQWRTSTYLHKCGAALLNENWAITAAHCVENVPPNDLLLRLGEHDLSSEDEPYGYQERRVQIVASHPQFDPRTFEYDLALLRFYEPVAFQPNILPVCVPQDDTSFVGKTAHVTGWGRLYEDGPLPSMLQEVSVPVINNTLCETMYRAAGYIEHIPDIFICAGWKKGGFDSCEGDSGGPMVIQRPDRRWLLAGVISWGIGCAEPNQPGVYTRISEFREWINQILQF